MKYLATTMSGRAVDVMNLQPEDVLVSDIVHALSLLPVFGAATKLPYTYAQHSVYMSYMCGEAGYPLEAMLHNAWRAYVPFPEGLTTDFDAAIARAKQSIETVLGLDYAHRRKDIEATNSYLLSMEAKTFLNDPDVVYRKHGFCENPVGVSSIDGKFHVWSFPECVGYMSEHLRQHGAIINAG